MDGLHGWAWRAPLSSTVAQNLSQIHVIELVMLSNHLILCHAFLLLPSIFLSIQSFPMSWLFESGNQIIGASASATVLAVNVQG